jgi:hypothetical protein
MLERVRRAATAARKAESRCVRATEQPAHERGLAARGMILTSAFRATLEFALSSRATTNPNPRRQ